MAFKKFTTLLLNKDARIASQSSFSRSAKLSDFQFNPEPGFLYVTTRAISSRVNANYDGWPPEELRESYRTFVGRPVYVDHNNWDLERSRGVILDAKLYEGKLASGHDDVWVELLIEVDAVAFPKLAQAIIDGDIDSVSMGADVEYTICSVCGNKAHDVLQYCAHIPQMKGRQVETIDKVAGKRIRKLCYEDCYGVSFFEISFVFDPADESALISDVMLASANQNRTLAHVRAASETVSDYSRRVGTTLMKTSSINTGGICFSCGSEDLSFTRFGSVCNECGVMKEADKTLMSLPEPVDTLRDELNCPQCGAEWDGMVCTACGFELPPEGLGDPNVEPFGIGLPMGKPDDAEGEQEGEQEEGSDDEDEEENSEESDGKAKKKKTSGSKEDMRVSRFDDLRKQATLPVDPPYRQDTSPAQSVPPYGQAIPGGTPVEGLEPAFEPAPAAPAMVQDLDAPDVQGPVGQSMVTVVNQPTGPTDVPPPGSQAGEALATGTIAGGEKAASKEERRAQFYLKRAEALRERAEEFEKKAEAVYVTDVRNLDEPPPVSLGPDATINVMAPTAQPEQLLLADTPDVINDGSETGLPAGPDFRERLPGQINPFNDASLVPYSPPGQMVAAKDESEDEEEKETKEASVEERLAEEKAHVEQRIAAAKTRVLRVANFVDERIEMGISKPSDKFTEIARFEEMDDATLDGYVQATREFKALESRTAGKRIRVASQDETADSPVRMPSLGSAPRVSSVSDEDDEEAMDYVAFL